MPCPTAHGARLRASIAWLPGAGPVHRQGPLPMERTARLFNCARCQRQRLICRACDRGQRYCGSACAQAARSTARRAAGARYQQSRPGRFTHAARQRRYRARRQKVTHRTSLAAPAGVSLPPSVPVSAVRAVSGSPSRAVANVCYGCGRACSAYLRLGFLRRGAETLRGFRSHPRRVPPRPSG